MPSCEETDPPNIVMALPADERKWSAIITGGEPRRVFDVLKLNSVNRENGWGDTYNDVYPALQELARYALRDHLCWQQLVLGGILDAVCDRVLDLTVDFEASKPLSASQKERYRKLVMSPYSPALRVLEHAVDNIVRPVTCTQYRTIQTLKRRWPQMVQHLWDNPENTHSKEIEFSAERTIIPNIAYILLTVDGDFIAMLDDADDLTISLCTRYFMHATDINDSSSVMLLLTSLISPTYCALPGFRPVRPVAPLLLEKVLRGAFSTEKLFSKFATLMVNMSDQEVPDIAQYLAPVHCFIYIYDPHGHAAIRRSSSIWTNLFLRMRRGAKATTSGEVPTGMFYKLYVSVLYTTQSCLNVCREQGQVGEFLALLLRVDFFGALEEALPHSISIPTVISDIGRIFLYIIDAVTVQPSLVLLLRTEFPRPRLLRPLLDNALDKHGFLKPPAALDPSDICTLHVSSEIWDRLAFRFLCDLQEVCIDPKLCARRTCHRPAKEPCDMCGAVRYCGPICLSRDLKDHKLVCCVQVFEAPNEQAVSEPQRLHESDAASQT